MAHTIPDSVRDLARRKGLVCYLETLALTRGRLQPSRRPYRVEHPSGKGYRGAFATLEALEARLNGFPDDPLTPP